MGQQTGAKPDSGFNDPLGMLKDCHRKIEQSLDTLCVVVEYAAERDLSDEETASVQAALHFFRVAGQRHIADEELSLFPRMVAHAHKQDLEDLKKLEREHDEANAQHAAVEELFLRWMADGQLDIDDHEQLRGATEQMRALYENHIEIEEQLVFPRAAQMLDPESITAMGQEFQVRREAVKQRS
jgi:hemerythrin-like domain-containing protein